MSDGLEGGTRRLTVLTAVSRVTGLLRDAVLSRVFGAGAVADALFIGFIIPNLFRRLFGEGALSAAFLPVYARLHRDDPEAARRLATAVIALLMVGLGLIVVLSECLLWLLLRTREEEAALAIRLTMIMLPYMPMVCVVAIIGAMLHVRGRFGPTATAPAVLNLFIVAAACAGFVFSDDDVDRVMPVALSVLAAGVVQLVWSFAALRRGDRAFALRTEGSGPSLRRVLGQALPMMVGLGVLQLNTLMDGLIASYPTLVGPSILGIDYPMEAGALASISYAQRLYQFPLGVFGIAIATAIFPLLARSSDRPEEFRSILSRGLRFVMLIGLPASAGLILVRSELATVILRGGDFADDDVDRVARVLLGYAPAIWAYSMIHVLARAFYALGDSMTPVRVACGVVILNILLNVVLIWPLGEAGLAWSTAVCAVLQAALLLLLLVRRTGFQIERDVVRSWTRSLTATFGMSVVVLVVRSLAAPVSWSGVLLHLLICVVFGASVFAIFGERSEIFGLITGRSQSVRPTPDRSDAAP